MLFFIAGLPLIDHREKKRRRRRKEKFGREKSTAVFNVRNLSCHLRLGKI